MSKIVEGDRIFGGDKLNFCLALGGKFDRVPGQLITAHRSSLVTPERAYVRSRKKEDLCLMESGRE